MTVRPKKYGRDQDFDGNKILNSSLNTDTISFIFSDIGTSIAGQLYYLDVFARYNYTLEKVFLRNDIDTVTLTMSINGIPISGVENFNSGGLMNIDLTGVSNIHVTTGDVLTLEVVTPPTDADCVLSGNIQIKRT